MKSSGQPLAISQRDAIGDAVERLSVLQGKHLTGAAKGLFAEELSDSGWPFDAIMAGLRSLEGVEIDRISLPLLKKAIQRHLEPKEEIRASCVNCGGFGVVLLEDPQRRTFSMACFCPNGYAVVQAQGLVVWNGLPTQISTRRNIWGKNELRVLVWKEADFPTMENKS